MGWFILDNCWDGDKKCGSRIVMGNSPCDWCWPFLYKPWGVGSNPWFTRMNGGNIQLCMTYFDVNISVFRFCSRAKPSLEITLLDLYKVGRRAATKYFRWVVIRWWLMRERRGQRDFAEAFWLTSSISHPGRNVSSSFLGHFISAGITFTGSLVAFGISQSAVHGPTWGTY